MLSSIGLKNEIVIQIGLKTEYVSQKQTENQICHPE